MGVPANRSPTVSQLALLILLLLLRVLLASKRLLAVGPLKILKLGLGGIAALRRIMVSGLLCAFGGVATLLLPPCLLSSCAWGVPAFA